MTEPSLAPEILDYYNAGHEQDRLTAPHRLIEYWRTLDILQRHLPTPPATIYDVGGGPGRYALDLAALGHHVHLLDPVPLHTEQARAASAAAEQPLAGVRLGDARALPYETDSADAVLLLGPLYHLTTAEDRHRAWAEAARVLRPGGTVIGVGASRYYTAWQVLSQDLLGLPGAESVIAEHLATGQHRNPGRDFERLWTTAYLHTPHELADEARTAGLGVRVLLAVEGPAKLLPNLAEQMTTTRGRDRVLAAIRRMEAEPSVLGLSSHILVVAGTASGTPGRSAA
ncbi:methyltransferase domain-containing protein [Streptomyces sp. NPDC086549]|uniref:class I SAM-dependent methyltransferase n=1 Tax=Streptomyces sp. NPDC086549 TaxID=3365752 RepID=UPI0037F5B533